MPYEIYKDLTKEEREKYIKLLKQNRTIINNYTNFKIEDFKTKSNSPDYDSMTKEELIEALKNKQ